MKTRVISGLVALVILFAVMFTDKAVLGFAIFIVSVIGVYEFYNAAENGGYRPVKAMGYIACVPLLIMALNGIIRDSRSGGMERYTVFYILAFFVMFIILFSLAIFLHKKFNITDIAWTVFGICYVPFMFAFITATRYSDGGFYYLWLVFIGAWVTDTSAYFTGKAFGKRKLLPAISPNKTVEGSIGGIVGCVVVTVFYGIFLNSGGYVGQIPVYHFVILGVINGIMSQIGDLSASTVKRYVKLKDYGSIMPGHGGVLDRFDSILFIAPVVYFYINLILLK